MSPFEGSLATRFRCAGTAGTRLVVSLVVGVLVVLLAQWWGLGGLAGYAGLVASVIYLVVSSRRGLACGLAGRAPSESKESSRLDE